MSNRTPPLAIALCAGVFVVTPCAADQWGPADSPTIFTPDYQYSLEALPTAGTASAVAWPSTYWPVYEDSINYRWDGPASESPAEKYALAFNAGAVPDAVSLHHGIDSFPNQPPCTDNSQCNALLDEVCAKRESQANGVCIPTWWGITRGPSAASLLYAEPQHPASHNGVTFKVNDIKALLALVLEGVVSDDIGESCSGPVASDLSGRPLASECRDSNPGAMHVVMTNELGIAANSFVEDRTFDDEVWNQPMSSFRSAIHSPMSAGKARLAVARIPRERRGFDLVADQFAVLGELPVSPGEQIEVRIAGSGNADLYVGFGSVPTLLSFDCRPLDPSSAETCEVTVPAGESAMFVAVHANGGPASGRVKLRLSRDAPYAYNPAAVSFVRVRTKRTATGQGEIQSDGSIPTFPVKSDLGYILELDGGGNVIGGEWLGDSKTEHPDFLWNPDALANPTPAAGGLITIENVKILHDLSID